MESPRLGYACINTVLQDTNLSVNRTCTAKTFREKGVNYAVSLAQSNLETVLKVLQWNEDHGIRFYRMSSDMFPHITNPEFLNGQQFAYPLEQFDPILQKIGDFALKFDHRLTFHPGQFNQVGAESQEVFEKTVRDLDFHAQVLDRMGLDENSILVVHGGGTYGNKEKTIKRWIEQFKKLPQTVQNRLVIENCERQYNWQDVLQISTALNIPVVFDTHHHQCYSAQVKPLEHPKKFIDQIFDTWRRRGMRPKCHISEQAPEKRVGAHSDYVEEIPDYLLQSDIDIMIEAKAKEQAVLQLYDKYCDFDFDKSIWRRKN